MKIRLTSRGMAMVKKLNIAPDTIKSHRPEYRRFTLIRIDGKGKAISRKKITIDINKYFKEAS